MGGGRASLYTKDRLVRFLVYTLDVSVTFLLQYREREVAKIDRWLKLCNIAMIYKVRYLRFAKGRVELGIRLHLTCTLSLGKIIALLAI
jgi:hypothetical protein